MKVYNVEYLGAVADEGQAPPPTVRGLVQVAFVGRSNVGKSSLINRLVGRTQKPLAHVSRRPGKTRAIHFYRVRTEAGAFCLVDLPGYGYAQAPRRERARWQRLVSRYLSGRSGPRGVVQLIDLRHGPSDEDLASLDRLARLGLPALVALTKADKLGPLRRQTAVARILERLRLDPEQVVPVSARTGEGAAELWAALRALLWGAADEAATGECRTP